MGTRNDLRTVTVHEPITLDDLRWLVEQTDGADGTSRVEVRARIDHIRDSTPASVAVHARPVQLISIPPGLGRRGPGDLPLAEHRDHIRAANLDKAL